jgi:hypothetical protein
MGSRITVQGIRRNEPNVRGFILALLELTRDSEKQSEHEGENASCPERADGIGPPTTH